jgi:predicted nucleotidyltransferase
VNANPAGSSGHAARHGMLCCGQEVRHARQTVTSVRDPSPSVRRIVEAHQARNPRVFGSIARGADSATSDLDLLVDTTESTSLFDLAAIELELEQLIGIPVHVTTVGALRGALRERVLAEAEPVWTERYGGRPSASAICWTRCIASMPMRTHSATMGLAKWTIGVRYVDVDD